MRKRVTQSLQLRIVKNNRLSCKDCLVSKPAQTDKLILCLLDGSPQEKAADSFCPQGWWIVEGAVRDFKDAFRKLYATEGMGSDKEIKVGEDGQEV